MRRIISTGCVVLAGLMGAPHDIPVLSPPSRIQADPRLTRLNDFLGDIESPVRDLAPDFLAAADRHTLDWRLLPSIAVVESGAGKNYTNNNIFGWGSCEKRFPSVRDGIHIVAARLAKSKLYRNKSVEGILNTYNPGRDYAARVKRIMAAIGPAQPVLQN